MKKTPQEPCLETYFEFFFTLSLSDSESEFLGEALSGKKNYWSMINLKREIKTTRKSQNEIKINFLKCKMKVLQQMIKWH